MRRVSVVSPSWCGPQHFPRVFDLGLQRLRSLGLEPVEHEFTRRQGTPEQRAADLHAAFSDPSTDAVVASIGGDDQVKVLRHLDPALLQANPKPFLGYSDNTNLHVLLGNLGIPSLHGGAVMVQLARPGRMHPVTEASLRAALLTPGPWQLPAPSDTTDVHEDWATVDLGREPAMRVAEPWHWHGTEAVSGPLWGGCLEILWWLLSIGTHVQQPAWYAGRVLLLETSEELPSADAVSRFLVALGERGLLQQFAGLVFARPKAWSPEQPDVRERYTAEQEDAVARAMAEYAPSTTWVYGVDAGHTDPMVVMPLGRTCALDPRAGTVTVTY